MKKAITVLLVLLMLFVLVPSASYADSGYSEAYDSFAVSEEYRRMAEVYDLVAIMKADYPELDDGRVFCVRYDAMYVTWDAVGSFRSSLENGEVILNEKTLRFHCLTVPIAEEASGLRVATAVIDRDGAVKISLNTSGEIITRKTCDEILFSGSDPLPLGYTRILLDRGVENLPYLIVHTDSETYFYEWYQLTQENPKGYTASRMGESLVNEREQNNKWFFVHIIVPAIILPIVQFIVLPVGGILLLLFLIWLTIHFYQKKKMKKKVQMLDTAEGKEST